MRSHPEALQTGEFARSSGRGGRIRDLGALVRYMRGEWRPTRVEERVMNLAGEQEGVIARRQLRAAGADDDWVDRRRAMGWLAPVFRGVYGIGHPPRTRRGWCF